MDIYIYVFIDIQKTFVYIHLHSKGKLMGGFPTCSLPRGQGVGFGGFGAPFLKAAQQFLKRLEEDWGDEMGGSVGQEMVGCTPFLMAPHIGKSLI